MLSFIWEADKKQSRESCGGQLVATVVLADPRRGFPKAHHSWAREAHPRTMSSPYLMGSSPGRASSPGEERMQEPLLPGCWRSEVRGDPTSGVPSSTILSRVGEEKRTLQHPPQPLSSAG